MNKTPDSQPAKATGDLVLQEVWRAKDTLSAAYGHDLDRLFAETSRREKLSGHPLVTAPARPERLPVSEPPASQLIPRR